MIKCKGCSKEFPVNAIQHHLKNKTSCKKEYSQEESMELKEICNEHRRQKLKASYQNRKKQKIIKVNIHQFAMNNYF